MAELVDASVNRLAINSAIKVRSLHDGRKILVLDEGIKSIYDQCRFDSCSFHKIHRSFFSCFIRINYG